MYYVLLLFSSKEQSISLDCLDLHFTVKISKYFYSLATFRSIKEILYTSDGERELDEVNIDELLGPTLSLLALSQNFNKISPNTI